MGAYCCGLETPLRSGAVAALVGCYLAAHLESGRFLSYVAARKILCSLP